MKCKIDGCSNKLMYKTAGLCQKHYFRVMRNGTHEKILKRNYRSRNGKGYQLLYEPNHFLSQKSGYVYEHRFVYFNQVDKNPINCLICGKEINWKILHIDHIDGDITNNKPENLRATCRACNTFRGHDYCSMTRKKIEINGVVMSAAAWSRVKGVKVSGSTILNRIKSGMNNYDAVYSEKITHKNNIPLKISKMNDHCKEV